MGDCGIPSPYSSNRRAKNTARWLWGLAETRRERGRHRDGGGRRRRRACLVRCHGADGRGPRSALVPVLHGQPSEALIEALRLSPPFYYWALAFTRHRLSERLGKLCFWLIFIGFNIAFLPMHLTGLRGMPRCYGGGTLSRPAGHG